MERENAFEIFSIPRQSLQQHFGIHKEKKHHALLVIFPTCIANLIFPSFYRFVLDYYQLNDRHNLRATGINKLFSLCIQLQFVVEPIKYVISSPYT